MKNTESKIKLKVKLKLSYDGTSYEGWQRQSAGQRTIQGELEKALSRILNEPITVWGSGRTDSGVHAQGQIAHFITSKDVTKLPLLNSLNSILPPDIGVIQAWTAPDDFHAQRSAICKTYSYRIHNSRVPDPLNARFRLWLKRPLDVEKLNEITKFIESKQDFKSFQTSGGVTKTTVREVIEAGWARNGDLVEFRIKGTGFLKQMVRNIVGTALYIHDRGLEPSEMQQILQAKDRQAAKATAPAQGLSLDSVGYPPELDNRCLDL